MSVKGGSTVLCNQNVGEALVNEVSADHNSLALALFPGFPAPECEHDNCEDREKLVFFTPVSNAKGRNRGRRV